MLGPCVVLYKSHARHVACWQPRQACEGPGHPDRSRPKVVLATAGSAAVCVCATACVRSSRGNPQVCLNEYLALLPGKAAAAHGTRRVKRAWRSVCLGHLSATRPRRLAASYCPSPSPGPRTASHAPVAPPRPAGFPMPQVHMVGMYSQPPLPRPGCLRRLCWLLPMQPGPQV